MRTPRPTRQRTCEVCGRPRDRVFKTGAICRDCDGRAMASQVSSLACLASSLWCMASARGRRPVACRFTPVGVLLSLATRCPGGSHDRKIGRYRPPCKSPGAIDHDDARARPIPRSGHRRRRRNRGVPWSPNRIDGAAAAQGHGCLPECSCLSIMKTPSWETSLRDGSPTHSCPGPSCLGRFLVLTPVEPDGTAPTARDRPQAPISRALRSHHHGPSHLFPASHKRYVAGLTCITRV